MGFFHHISHAFHKITHGITHGVSHVFHEIKKHPLLGIVPALGVAAFEVAPSLLSLGSGVSASSALTAAGSMPDTAIGAATVAAKTGGLGVLSSIAKEGGKVGLSLATSHSKKHGFLSGLESALSGVSDSTWAKIGIGGATALASSLLLPKDKYPDIPNFSIGNIRQNIKNNLVSQGIKPKQYKAKDFSFELNVSNNASKYLNSLFNVDIPKTNKTNGKLQRLDVGLKAIGGIGDLSGVMKWASNLNLPKINAKASLFKTRCEFSRC